MLSKNNTDNIFKQLATEGSSAIIFHNHFLSKGRVTEKKIIDHWIHITKELDGLGLIPNTKNILPIKK